MSEPTPPPLAAATEADPPRPDAGGPFPIAAVLAVAIAALLLWRVAYHAAYVVLDPFARVTLSDGQLYEEAARDLLAHPPLGTQPFYLQGIYACLLALGMALRGELLDALLLQLVLAGAALWVFFRAAKERFGALSGAFSLLVLLVAPALAFYENKFLSAAFGVLCNAGVLLAFVRFSAAPSATRAGWLGAASGLALLARPNLVFALPFTLLATWLVAHGHKSQARGLLVRFALGVALVLAPMAARNFIVTGRPTVLASHGGGIPFYIGNGPRSTGLWNDAGGLLSGQVAREQDELATKLGIDAHGDALDKAIGQALYARAFSFMQREPLAWLALEGKKLRYTLGNHEHIHDYDLLGERELLGITPLALPFGVILGLGVLGLAWLWQSARRGSRPNASAAHDVALLLVLGGQVVAVLLANLIWFSASQHRMPLVLPLAFCAGPMLAGLWTRVARPGPIALVAALLLTAQAFIPQPSPTRPSSVHYYNLAAAEEELGRHAQALAHYAAAAERAPKQPMFLFRYAYLARRMQRDAEARSALDKLLARPSLPADIEAAARNELRLLDARKH